MQNVVSNKFSYTERPNKNISQNISLPTSSQEQPEDGPHTGPKHAVTLSCSYSDIVVFLTEYIYIYIYTHI
jgi:hypothetical protein